ncbi:hypothetical protein [Synechococcus sp. PCC 7336]|uniref:hypothetical protein n=1 Tax=Synechococcus sp. PCC 7336 TaxID=195250 RepID=UPI0003496854|nr:hypothetical protein [Synechococcus sp. PCC 7336]
MNPNPILRLRQFLTVPQQGDRRSLSRWWLAASWLFSLTYSSLALQQAFAGDYIIQDDARQHVFWMYRYLDPNLFPHDLIADYFQSVAPAGYKALYGLLAQVGIEPVVASKLLPTVLGLLTTYFCFQLAFELLPVPFSAFLASLLLNQNLWGQDGLISATPRAFLYPIFLAFLWALQRRSPLGVSCAIAALGTFYPSLVLVCATLLVIRALSMRAKFPYLGLRQEALPASLSGLAIAAAVIFAYALGTSTYGPAISAEQARLLPEFAPNGRTSFFSNGDLWQFWLNGSRSGLNIAAALIPPLAYGSLLLPVLLRVPRLFDLGKQVRDKVGLLWQLLAASGVMFLTAHALLFRLHLPSRYTVHSLRIAAALAAALAIALLLDTTLKTAASATRHRRSKELFALLSVGLLAIATIGYPATQHEFIETDYVTGTKPALYQFFRQQPGDRPIASLSAEANNLPTFAQRSILTGAEYAIPFQQGYYSQIRQRTLDLFAAQYTLSPNRVVQFLNDYNVGFWLLDRNAFTTSAITGSDWLKQFQPIAAEAIATLDAGDRPALMAAMGTCSVFESEAQIVLSADCIKTELAPGDWWSVVRDKVLSPNS